MRPQPCGPQFRLPLGDTDHSRYFGLVRGCVALLRLLNQLAPIWMEKLVVVHFDLEAAGK